jgi:hypothetical protein
MFPVYVIATDGIQERYKGQCSKGYFCSEKQM